MNKAIMIYLGGGREGSSFPEFLVQKWPLLVAGSTNQAPLGIDQLFHMKAASKERKQA